MIVSLFSLSPAVLPNHNIAASEEPYVALRCSRSIEDEASSTVQKTRKAIRHI